MDYTANYHNKIKEFDKVADCSFDEYLSSHSSYLYLESLLDKKCHLSYHDEPIPSELTSEINELQHHIIVSVFKELSCRSIYGMDYWFEEGGGAVSSDPSDIDLPYTNMLCESIALQELIVAYFLHLRGSSNGYPSNSKA